MIIKISITFKIIQLIIKIIKVIKIKEENVMLQEKALNEIKQNIKHVLLWSGLYDYDH